MKLKLINKEIIGENVIKFTLIGLEAKSFKPGSHISLETPLGVKRYSIISSSNQSLSLEIAVLKIEGGSGGSKWLHEDFQVGDEIEAEGPFEYFQLVDESRGKQIFLAGGIGITPIYSFVQELEKLGRKFELHYGFRSEGRGVFTEKIKNLSHGSSVFYSADKGTVLDVSSVIPNYVNHSNIYVCGPRGMIEAVRDDANKKGWPASSVHFESFGVSHHRQSEPVTVSLLLTEVELSLMPGDSLLDAIESTGAWVSYECKRGECGKCVLEYLDGEVDHHDLCLSPEARKTMMCPCVSRPSSKMIKLSV